MSREILSRKLEKHGKLVISPTERVFETMAMVGVLRDDFYSEKKTTDRSVGNVVGCIVSPEKIF